jgi:hypothetical protein
MRRSSCVRAGSSITALAQIDETLRGIYERADAQGISTAAAADALAEEPLS